MRLAAKLFFCAICFGVALWAQGWPDAKWPDSGKREGICTPEPIHTPLPEIWNRFSGELHIEAILDKTGKFSEVNLRNPPPDEAVRQAAQNTILEWRFEPALKDSNPIAVRFQATINYQKDSISLTIPGFERRRGCIPGGVRF